MKGSTVALLAAAGYVAWKFVGAANKVGAAAVQAGNLSGDLHSALQGGTNAVLSIVRGVGGLFSGTGSGGLATPLVGSGSPNAPTGNPFTDPSIWQGTGGGQADIFTQFRDGGVDYTTDVPTPGWT